MNPKNYCLRGIGVGLIIFIASISILFFLSMYKFIECNELITVGQVEQNFLCPLFFQEGWTYLILISIYFGICAFLGKLYGNRKLR